MADYDLSKLPVTHEAKIPEAYRDVMGHMNVMWYTHLFDTSIFGMFDLLGLNLEYMQKRNGGSFALESHTRYLAEVCVGDDISIHTRVLGRTAKRFHMLGLMTEQSRQVLSATFEVVGAYIDMQQRRMAPMPTEIGERLDAIVVEHSLLDWEPPTCGAMKP